MNDSAYKETHLLPWDTDTLFQGCLLASVFHAVAVAKNPECAYEQSWDGINYSFICDEGRGTVSFAPVGLVFGAIRNEEAERSRDFSWTRLAVASLPAPAASLARGEALQYILDRVDGLVGPLATTMFWTGGGGGLVSWDAPAVFREMGGSFLDVQAMPVGRGAAAWSEYWEMTPADESLAMKLFEEKVGHRGTGPIPVAGGDASYLRDIAEEGGLDEARRSLAELGFALAR